MYLKDEVRTETAFSEEAYSLFGIVVAPKVKLDVRELSSGLGLTVRFQVVNESFLSFVRSVDGQQLLRTMFVPVEMSVPATVPSNVQQLDPSSPSS